MLIVLGVYAYSVTKVFSFSTNFVEKISGFGEEVVLLSFPNTFSLLPARGTCLIFLFLIQVPWREAVFAQLSLWSKVVTL